MKILFSLITLCIYGQSYAQTAVSVDIAKEITSIENGLLPKVQVKGETQQPQSIAMLMAEVKVPGISIAVAKDGKLHFAKGYGISNSNTGSKVNENTIFQAGSISKPLAAIAALKLVDEGKVDLDKDINVYLRSWKVPESEFTTKEKVTLRRLLTHTAGTTVHGFPGYKENEVFPTIETVLNGTGNTPNVFVDTEPGSNWRYSGGGYTIIEKMIEDVSQMSLDQYMQTNIFPKLGMMNSTYSQPLPKALFANASLAYDRKGKIIDGSYHNYPEQAAAGLWTTPSDLVKYIFEIQAIVNGKEDGILSPEIVSEMLTKHMGSWGLGPSLRGEDADLLFGHGGKNAGFTNNLVANVNKGSGIVIMTNGDNGNDIIGKLQTAISEYYDMGISTYEIIEVIELNDDVLDKFVGKYKYTDDKDFYIKMKVKKGQLVAKIGSEHFLSPIGPLTFRDLKDPETITFSEDENGNIVGLKLQGPGIEFDKVK